MKSLLSRIWLWSVLVGVLIFIIFAINRYAAPVPVYAAHITNISPAVSDHWAWNDLIGWIDFYNTDTVIVKSAKLEGYASSSAGDISLDCATTRIGNICAISNYGVLNDGVGNLSGWGWNDVYGWISFCGGLGTSDCPGAIDYRVVVEPSTGVFIHPTQKEYAWNDVAGWISFNCVNQGQSFCDNVSNYRVVTTWVSTSTSATFDSTIYDTGVSLGAQLNSVLWRGSRPAGTAVRFQFATANVSTGPWNYKGPDGTSGTYYEPTGPDVSLKLDYALHNDQRYFRYRTFLISNQAQTQTPQVDEVIVNWSF